MKKLCKVVILCFMFVGLVGCYGRENEQNNDITTEQKSNEIQFIELSMEESQKLEEGAFIEKLDETTLKVPNREELEKRGLDYEIVLGTISINEDGSERDLNQRYYVYDQKLQGDIDVQVRTFINDQNEEKSVRDYLIGVQIVPIIAAYQDPANNLFYKTIQMTDYEYTAELIHPENLEKLQQLISKKYSE